MRTVFIIILFIIRFTGLGQSTKLDAPPVRHHWVEDSTHDNRFCIKTAPLALIDGYSGPSYRLGVECKIYKNISVYFEAGGYFPWRYMFSSYLTGSNIRPGIKYYLNKKGFTTGYFLSLQYMYKQQRYDWADSVFLDPHYYKQFQVTKYINCFDIGFGSTKVFHNNFIFEYFGGIGIRSKYVITKGISQQELNSINDDGSVSDYYEREPGRFTYLDITAGLKIGYRFK